MTSLFGLSRYLDRTFAQRIGSVKVKSESKVTEWWCVFTLLCCSRICWLLCRLQTVQRKLHWTLLSSTADCKQRMGTGLATTAVHCFSCLVSAFSYNLCTFYALQCWYTGWAKKSKPQTFIHIFAKYLSIFTFFYQHILWKICTICVAKYATAL